MVRLKLIVSLAFQKLRPVPNHVLTIRQDLFSIKKIMNEDIKKNLRVAVGLNFLVGVLDF
jgi:hypothetical protein